MKSKASIIKCESYEPEVVLQATKRALDYLGGIENFIKPSSKVLVKPNLLMAKEPEFCVTTHPEVVRSVIKILKALNCEIRVGDGPCVWGGQSKKEDEVYERTGIKKVCQEEDVALVKFDKRRWHGKFPLTSQLDECDYLVNVPKFKSHTLTTLTGAIKNLFGLVPDTFKTELHKNYFHVDDFTKIIVDIFQESKPALTIIDAVFSMQADGPGTSGEKRNTGLILAGSDCVALDSILALIMNLEPFEILTTREAAKRGLGEANICSIEILGEKLEDFLNKSFKLPATSFARKNIPKPLIGILKKLIKYYPLVKDESCTRCSICVKICPGKAISMKDRGIVFDYSKCIACFCCQEACPAAAIKIKKSIFAKMIGL